MTTMTNTSEALIEEITGLVICGGGVETEGMHLHLDDGRTLVISGYFAVGLLQAETLQ